MNRSKTIAAAAAFSIFISTAAIASASTQVRKPSPHLASTSAHKVAPTTTSSKTGSGSRSMNGSAASPSHASKQTARRANLHAPLHGTPKPAPDIIITIHRHSGVSIYRVSRLLMAEWSKVAICEEGGNWHVRGSLYSGGLGITNSNWKFFSRGLGFPANAADATPAEQVYVAQRINQGYGIPDQHGCAAW